MSPGQADNLARESIQRYRLLVLQLGLGLSSFVLDDATTRGLAGFDMSLEGSAAPIRHPLDNLGALDAQQVVDAELAGCLFGLPPADTTHQKALDRVYPADRERVLQAFMAGAEGRAPYDIEYRVVWPDGSLHWLRSIGRRTEDAGHAPRFLGVTYEVTQEKAAAEQIQSLNAQLREKVRELETVFEVAPIGLGFGADPKCEAIVANDALATMLEHWNAFTSKIDRLARSAARE